MVKALVVAAVGALGLAVAAPARADGWTGGDGYVTITHIVSRDAGSSTTESLPPANGEPDYASNEATSFSGAGVNAGTGAVIYKEYGRDYTKNGNPANLNVIVDLTAN